MDHPARAEHALHRGGHGDHVSVAIDDDEVGGAAGLLGGVRRAEASPARLSGRGRRAGDLRRDQGRPGLEIGRIQKALHRHVDKVRVAEIAVAVGVHQPAGLGEEVPALHRVRAMGSDVGVGQDAQTHQHGRPARGRRRHADHIDPVGPADRLGDLRLISLQVGQRQGARQVPLGGAPHDGLGNLALQQGGGTLGGNLAQGGGVGRVLEDVAGLDQLAVRLGEIGHGVGLAPPGGGPGGQGGQARGDGKALVGQGLSLGEEVLPGQASVGLLGHIQHGHGPGHAGGPAAGHGVDKGQGLSVGAQKHVGRGAGRGRLAAIVDGHLAGLGVVIGDEGPAAEARALRLHQAQGRLHRHGGVHRRAAAPQHRDARLHRQGMGGGDHAGLLDLGGRSRRRRLPRQGRACRQGQGQDGGGNEGGLQKGNSAHGGLTTQEPVDL